GFEFQHPAPAASGTEPAQRQGGPEAHMPVHLAYDDASLGSTLDALGTGEDEQPVAHVVVYGSEDLSQPAMGVLDEIDLPSVLGRAVHAFVDRIQRDLEQDADEAALDGEIPPTRAAVEKCIRLARSVAPVLVLVPGLRRAAFAEESGGVSLVLRSEITDRRVDFTISADGLHISAVYIDENLTAKSVPLAVDDRSSLRETAAWVYRRA
ncbi:MAG: hypothetical protein WBE26_18040, partial [Phycisphaerae bacterium]